MGTSGSLESEIKGRTDRPKRVVIIGNGVAGISCAFTVRQRDSAAKITVISGETDYFFSRTALMYAFMDRMPRRSLEPFERSAYVKKRIDLVRGWVVDLNSTKKQVILENKQIIPYDKLVLAVGARANIFPWNGVDQVKDGLVHFVSMQDLDACERLTPSTQRAVVVGGGLIGIELVECLLHHHVDVTFLIREPYYWPMALGREEADVVTESMRRHGVDVRLEEELANIHINSSGRVEAIETNQNNRIDCQMLGITAGVRPNIDRLRDFTDTPELGRGIVVDQALRTSLEDVWACGDCAEIHLPDNQRPVVESIWYSAKRQGHYVARNLFGDGLEYQRPTFYNSSKFFDIEYTTVGDVNTAPNGSETIYRKMDGKPISQRIVHDGTRVLGFNMLGSRWNHEYLVRWVEEGRHPNWVLENLHRAQYDVEFGRVKLDRMTEQELPLEPGQ